MFIYLYLMLLFINGKRNRLNVMFTPKFISIDFEKAIV